MCAFRIFVLNVLFWGLLEVFSAVVVNASWSSACDSRAAGADLTKIACYLPLLALITATRTPPLHAARLTPPLSLTLSLSPRSHASPSIPCLCPASAPSDLIVKPAY